MQQLWLVTPPKKHIQSGDDDFPEEHTLER